MLVDGIKFRASGAPFFFVSATSVERQDVSDVRSDLSATPGDAAQGGLKFAIAVLFGALGALAGAALVILMLVALVIPATTTFALSAATMLMMIVVGVIWINRRRRGARENPIDPIATTRF